MKEWSWNNGDGRRGREARCVVVDAVGNVHDFVGKDILGVVKVMGSDYEKAGKWSNHTYRCISPENVTPVIWRQDWNTGETFPQDTWEEAFMWLASIAPRAEFESFVSYVRKYFPKAASKFDNNAAALAEFEKFEKIDDVVISFGCPTNRQIREGWWDAPKTQDGVTVAPGSNGWSNPVVIEPAGAVVLSSVHTRGMHGGYYKIRVAIAV